MKKFFAVLAIAAAITACNNEGESSKTETDTTIKPVDSPTVSTPAPTVNTDSLRRADSIRIADSLKNVKKK